MNDVEHDLRELLDKKAGSVGTVAPRLPDGVRKRGRRRQLATTAMGTVAAVAIGVVSLAGLQAIDRAQPDGAVPVGDPWAGYTVFERTATIETLTLTTPSDWYLVNQWPMGARASKGSASSEASRECDLTIPPDGQAPTGDCGSPQPSDQRVGSTTLPLLMLSNVDLGLGRSACLDGGLPLDGDEAVLEVAIDTAAVDQIEAGAGPDLPAWPAGFDEDTVTSGPCGQGYYVRFQVGRYPYIAWVGLGPDVTSEDRRSLFDLASTMQVDARAFIQGTPEETPAYVIAGGQNAAGPWRLELRPSTSDAPTANVDLSVVSPEGGAGAADFTVPGGALIEQAGGDPVFGAVTKDAAGVEIRSNSLLPGPAATIVPLPPSLPFDFDLFFGSHEGDAPPTAVPVDAAGDPIDPVPSNSAPLEPTADERRRVAEGETGGAGWALEYEEGRELALVGSSDDILFHRIAFNHMASLSAENPMLIGAHDFGTTEQALFMLYGVSHPDVDRIVITLVDGQVIELGRGTMRDPSIHIFGQNPSVSPGVWWVQMPPGPVVANVTAFDAACQRVGRAGLALRPEGAEQEEITTKAGCPTLGG